jgi:dynein heavy chain
LKRDEFEAEGQAE